MKEKELDKFLENKLGKEVIDALDERYFMTREINPEECEQNPIIAKKKKIADFYNSIDDEEKLLLGAIFIFPEINGETLNSMRTFSSEENHCKDFEELVDARFKKISSRITSNILEKSRKDIQINSSFPIW